MCRLVVRHEPQHSGVTLFKIFTIHIIHVINSIAFSLVNRNVPKHVGVRKLTPTYGPLNTLVVHGDAGDIVNLDNNTSGQSGIWQASTSNTNRYEFVVDGGVEIIGRVIVDVDVSVNLN